MSGGHGSGAAGGGSPASWRQHLTSPERRDAVLEALSRGLTQKMLHGSMTALRQGSDAERAQAAATVQRLFLRGRTAQGSQR